VRVRHLGAVVLVFAALVALSTTIYANHDGRYGVGSEDCPHLTNYTDTACNLGTVTYGLRAQWHNNWMTMDPALIAAGDHVNHALWAYSGSPGCGDWAEIGVTRGFQGQDVYTYYEAASTAFGVATIQIKTPAATWDGTNHTYATTDDGGGTYDAWSVYLDGVQENQFTGLGQGSCVGQAGLEISGYNNPNPPDSRTHSDTFDLTPLERRDSFGGAWVSGWTGHYFIHFPCGTYPNLQCFNGVYNSGSYWADNKP
jgi:hypothetical protein